MINKKGQLIGEAMALPVTTAIIILLLIVFFLLISAMKIGKGAEDISPLMIKEQGTISLISYLNTPAEVNNQEIKMSDLIMLTTIDGNYKSVLENKTKEIFGKSYGNYQFWIVKDDKNLLEINPLASTKYGWIQTKIEMPGKTTVYLQLERGKNG